VTDKDDSADGTPAPAEDGGPRLRVIVSVPFEVPADLNPQELDSLNDECVHAAELALRGVLKRRGYEHGDRSVREQVYQVLLAGPPVLHQDGFDAVVTNALREIKYWLREECKEIAGVTVETVRGMRGIHGADHDAAVRACFRACKVRGSGNLGKADAMKTSRVEQALRESRTQPK
jgi:hypothetical protein